MTLLNESPSNESDADRRKRLSRSPRTPNADAAGGNDDLTRALEDVWTNSAAWGRAIRAYFKDERDIELTPEHARDILAAVLRTKPFNWLTVTQSRPSKILVANMIARLQAETPRLCVVPGPANFLAVWGDETTVKHAIATYGFDTCRRRRYRGDVAATRELRELTSPARHRPGCWMHDGTVRT